GLTGSPVVCLAGQHPTTEDQLGSFQEAYGADICRTFSKFTKRVLDWSTIAVDVRLAFREAMSSPPGPALVEIPTNILYHHDDAAKQHRGARVYAPAELRSAGDPAAIERALEALARAERRRSEARAPAALRPRRHAPDCAPGRRLAGRGGARARAVRAGAARAGGGGARARADPSRAPDARSARADGPGCDARDRQLHALGLALAVVRGALPRADRGRRPARARRSRHRHGDRGPARAPGQAGDRRHRRRRLRHRRHGARDRAPAPAAARDPPL